MVNASCSCILSTPCSSTPHPRSTASAYLSGVPAGPGQAAGFVPMPAVPVPVCLAQIPSGYLQVAAILVLTSSVPTASKQTSNIFSLVWGASVSWTPGAIQGPSRDSPGTTDRLPAHTLSLSKCKTKRVAADGPLMCMPQGSVYCKRGEGGYPPLTNTCL